MATRRESELYLPIKRFLEVRGFTVRAEVNDCDLMAIRGDDIVVVELKPAFCLNLVLQGIDRQTTADHVYLAVEAPRGRKNQSHWNDIRRLCGRLGLGLLYVQFGSAGVEPIVEVVRECGVTEVRHNKRKASLLKKEFGNRSGDYNLGGSARGAKHVARPVVTAYRETALRVAQFLQSNGPSRLKDIRNALQLGKIDSIIEKNYYGWFVRTARGVYNITAEGSASLSVYADVVAEHSSTYLQQEHEGSVEAEQKHDAVT